MSRPTTTWGMCSRTRGDFRRRFPPIARRSASGPATSTRSSTWAMRLRAVGRLPEAIECYNQGLGSTLATCLLHTARAMVRIQMGDLVQGFPECEWRLHGRAIPSRRFAQPVWDGSPLDGRTILVCTEQGLGDSLQFIRYATRLPEQGGRVVVACPRQPGPDRAELPGRGRRGQRAGFAAGVRLPCSRDEPGADPGHDASRPSRPRSPTSPPSPPAWNAGGPSSKASTS